MSNKTFFLFIVMWISWAFLGVDLIESNHWICDVPAYRHSARYMTFVTVD